MCQKGDRNVNKIIELLDKQYERNKSKKELILMKYIDNYKGEDNVDDLI